MLEARGLTKHYSYLTAVRQVSFSIKPGEILGYLGPNGAGKSTTVKMLTGLIEPSEGQIVYNGHSIYDDLCWFSECDRIRTRRGTSLSASFRSRVPAAGRPIAGNTSADS